MENRGTRCAIRQKATQISPCLNKGRLDAAENSYPCSLCHLELLGIQASGLAWSMGVDILIELLQRTVRGLAHLSGFHPDSTRRDATEVCTEAR